MKHEFLESNCCSAKIIFVEKLNTISEKIIHAICEKCKQDCKSKSIMQ